jgi:aryl-alcohol dehydrogenase-like predicted oxidoreductase
MQYRQLGKTGLSVSVLGFGCGTVGGLMTRGEPGDQERAVARALDLGINYFDTAAQYGEGKSEQNLGRVLAALKPDIVLATKVKVPAVEKGGIGAAITASLEASLRRLGRERVDLYQLHNAITEEPRPSCLTSDQVLDEVVPAMQRLQKAGKVGHFGMTGLGDTEPMLRIVDSGMFVSAQVPLNLLNPTPARPMPAGYPAQDYKSMLTRMQAAQMGAVSIRVFAGGALSGAQAHPLARGEVGPMGSGSSFAADKARAAHFETIVREGHAESLGHAAIRYALANPVVSTVLVGLSGPEQLDDAERAIAAGPLSDEAMQRVAEIQDGLVGEQR